MLSLTGSQLAGTSDQSTSPPAFPLSSGFDLRYSYGKATLPSAGIEFGEAHVATSLFLPFGLGLLLEANDQASRRGERPSVECLCIRQEPSVSAAAISTRGNTLPLMDTSILVARSDMLKGQQLARLAKCG